MNKVVLMGRLVREPDVRTSNSGMVVTKYCMAVDRVYKKDGEPSADFINCTAFGRAAEFASKYFLKGTKICIEGRIQTSSYTDNEGKRINKTEIIVESQEFAESKKAQAQNESRQKTSSFGQTGNSEKGQETSTKQSSLDDFIDIPDSIDEELPWQ